MDEVWNVNRRWEDVQLSSSSDQPLKYLVSDSGIVCTVECRIEGSDEIWRVAVAPEEAFASGCALLIDLLFVLDGRHFRMEREMCEERTEVFRVQRAFQPSATIRLCFRVVDLCPVHDLSVQSAHRNFQLICEGKSIYVDTAYLASLGGTLFPEWDEMNSRGESQLSITELSLTRLKCLIDATSKYGGIVVTRDNYETLLNVASMYKIGSILRKIETCLIEMKSIDPIRKLELAAIYQLAQLGDAVTRKLLSSGKAIHAVHHYLRRNNEFLHELHPDVLLSLNIHSGYIIE